MRVCLYQKCVTENEFTSAYFHNIDTTITRRRALLLDAQALLVAPRVLVASSVRPIDDFGPIATASYFAATYFV